MRVILILFLFPVLLSASAQMQLKKGLIISRSTTIAPGLYTLDADSSAPVITIKGSDIVIDFSKAVLRGSNKKQFPDEFFGVALKIEKGSKNIVIRNLNVHGYKVGIYADSVINLTVENCDLSFNWKQKLHSNRLREDVSDWMSYHHNENDEWLRYGAAIYLKNVSNSFIRNNVVRNGQCALMMTRSHHNEISNNDFSFNSAIGIGMYRSSNNRIIHNYLDWNVRGFSYGKYNRGQDSAAILVFEQCNENVFALNSATHSGDGFFLWAGQHTMDTGKGGCNNNLLFRNDFSFAPTNGIEVTFSRNQILENTIIGCDHGIWGGYSFETDIFANLIKQNRIGVAIEHGQENDISHNSLIENKTAIKLWSRATQPADWGYAKYRDTRSRHYTFLHNRFDRNNIRFDIMGTDSIVLQASISESVQTDKFGERLGFIDSSSNNDTREFGYPNDDRVRNLPYSNPEPLRYPAGRSEIRVTEWGPYNFAYPLLWLRDVDSTGKYHFDVMGTRDSVSVTKLTGFRILERKGKSITAAVDSSVQQRIIEMRIQPSADFRDEFGVLHKKQKAYIFSYKEFNPRAEWTINWYKWDIKNDPNKNYSAFVSSLTNPVKTLRSRAVDFTWWGAIDKNLPADSFATVATSTIDIPKGEYEITITADDLVKLFIDETEVINAWDAKYVQYDEYTNHPVRIRLNGKHKFKIIHAENAGLATLMFYLKPIR